MENADKSRILVIFAHPDDTEFTSGGTIACWAAEGYQQFELVEPRRLLVVAGKDKVQEGVRWGYEVGDSLSAVKAHL